MAVHGARSFGDLKTIAHIAHIAYIMLLISIQAMTAWLRATILHSILITIQNHDPHCPHCPQ